VLVWRRGIPISLAQLHAAVGRRAGLPVQPVAVPMVRARRQQLQGSATGPGLCTYAVLCLLRGSLRGLLRGR